MQSEFNIYGKTLGSRLILGSALYPNPTLMQQALQQSGCEAVTLSLRRQAPEQQGGEQFWQLIRDLNLKLMPNTAGCH